MGENVRLRNPLTEAHFCGLQSQSNVYGLCKIDLPNKPNEILVSSLRGKVMSLGFNKTKSVSREVRFTYIPGDAEIISIDAFNKFHHGSNVVIGITFIKVLDGKPFHYLNVYSEWERSKEYNLDSIAQGWHNIELGFTPYQLTHTEYVHEGNVEVVFLLSGSDQRVHIFREEKEFTEVTDIESCFPEFSDLSSNVTWLQCEYYQDYQRRVTASGFFNGMIQVTVVNTQTLEFVERWSTQHDSPVTSLKLFALKTDVECPDFVTQVLDTYDDPLEYNCPELNLLVNSAMEVSVIYRNVAVQGFSKALLLTESEEYDCTLCGCVADIDLDGENEVIIGTYGQEILAYKFFCDEPTKIINATNSLVNKDDENTVTTKTTEATDISQPSQSSPLEQYSSEPSVSIPSSLDLTLNSPEKQTVTQVQSPLDFHSGHFNVTSPEGKALTEETNNAKEFEDRKAAEVTPDIDLKNIQDETTSLKVTEDESATSNLTEVDSAENNVKLKNLITGNGNVNLSIPSLWTEQTEPTFETGDGLKVTTGKDCVPGEFRLFWKQSFAEPVFAIDSLDITGDGLEELIVLTQKGIHVLQHDPQHTAELCLQRLKQATFHLGAQEDVFKQLLSENLTDSFHEDLRLDETV